MYAPIVCAVLLCKSFVLYQMAAEYVTITNIHYMHALPLPIQ